MVRCGCASGACTCELRSGDKITLTGLGTVEDPYEVSVGDVVAYVRAVSTPTLSMAITGGGTVANPYRLSADYHSDAPQGMLIQTFTTSGVWTKPVGRMLAKVTVIGAGGGGASGTIWRTKTGVVQNAPGGQAGYQGFRFTQTFLMSELPAAVTCTVGVGGAGGTRATLGAATTPGTYQRSNAGSTGGNSQFGTFIMAQGNGGGPASAASNPTLPYDAGSAGWYGGYGGSLMSDGVTTPVGLVGQNAPDSGGIPGGAGGTSGSEAAGNGKPGSISPAATLVGGTGGGGGMGDVGNQPGYLCLGTGGDGVQGGGGGGGGAGGYTAFLDGQYRNGAGGKGGDGVIMIISQ
jgi:hypothetical protein